MGILLKMDKKLKIIGIQGVNATGKSTLAHSLSGDFIEYDIIATDNLVAINRMENPNDLRIRYSSYASWKRFGKPTKENIWKGFREYRNSNEKYLDCILRRARDQKVGMIIEGVHIDPELFYKYKDNLDIHLFLLNIEKEEIHKDRIRQKCSYRPDLLKDLDYFFSHIRILQDLLLEESKKYGMEIIETGMSMGSSLNQIRGSLR